MLPQGPVTLQLDSRKFEYVDPLPTGRKVSTPPSGLMARNERPVNKVANAAADVKQSQESLSSTSQP
ncbi:hypothetical protein EW146_g564 [Bondarzewia mesenterica]|uniref:Uncharacterized protein n=1 Tax=Bondarzewia mesenterica TaxID=1095465 RepID=A0A4S4M725_9AGAM|nr:hypothetical protein EW146_g564 [Bondarzewia mesenterica]